MRFRVAACAVVLAAVGPFCSCAMGWAQVDAPSAPVSSVPLPNAGPLIHLEPAEVQTLAEALRSVVKQVGGVAFVAEGKPFRARNSAPPLLPVIAKWPANGLPLQEAVLQIAHAYDYEAERKGDVFLFRKRYTNPDDLPDVSADELRLALRDASRAASALPAPTVPPADFGDVNSPFMASFFRTLKPSVQAETSEPTFSVVLASSLTPPQKEALWQCAVSRHIQAATGKATTAFQALQTLERKSTVFSMADATGKNQKVLSYAPERWDKAVFPDFAVKGHLRGNTPTPADYNKDSSPLPAFELSEIASVQTLQSLCATDKKPAPFSVDPSLSRKTILVVTPQNIKGDGDLALREAVFKAAGEVYGLRVLHAPSGGFHLTRTRVAAAKELAELNAAVLSTKLAQSAPPLAAWDECFHACVKWAVLSPRKNLSRVPSGRAR